MRHLLSLYFKNDKKCTWRLPRTMTLQKEFKPMNTYWRYASQSYVSLSELFKHNLCYWNWIVTITFWETSCFLLQEQRASSATSYIKGKELYSCLNMSLYLFLCFNWRGTRVFHEIVWHSYIFSAHRYREHSFCSLGIAEKKGNSRQHQ